MCSPALGRPIREIAVTNRAAGDERVRIDGADDETSGVVLALGIQTGHLRRLATDQGETVLPAGGGHPADQSLQHIPFESPHRDVVEEEKGAGAAGEDIVDAVIDEIGTDATVGTAAEYKSEFELRADAIGAGDQEPVRSGIEPVDASEVTDGSRRSGGGEGRVRVRFQPVNRSGRRVDVDAGVAIGNPSA
ncbi:MAG: hypothetical protein QOG89_144 [Thermomicrobiales bacterium]|nr:hypothetical protein [Thermomicrobiales bacterium]